MICLFLKYLFHGEYVRMRVLALHYVLFLQKAYYEIKEVHSGIENGLIYKICTCRESEHMLAIWMGKSKRTSTGNKLAYLFLTWL